MQKSRVVHKNDKNAMNFNEFEFKILYKKEIPCIRSHFKSAHLSSLQPFNIFLGPIVDLQRPLGAKPLHQMVII